MSVHGFVHAPMSDGLIRRQRNSFIVLQDLTFDILYKPPTVGVIGENGKGQISGWNQLDEETMPIERASMRGRLNTADRTKVPANSHLVTRAVLRQLGQPHLLETRPSDDLVSIGAGTIAQMKTGVAQKIRNGGAESAGWKARCGLDRPHHLRGIALLSMPHRKAIGGDVSQTRERSGQTDRSND